MKITKKRLKQIIKEEASILTENRAKLSETEKKNLSRKLAAAQDYLTFIVQDVDAGQLGPREYDVLKALATLAGYLKGDMAEILRKAGIPTSDSMKKDVHFGTFE